MDTLFLAGLIINAPIQRGSVSPIWMPLFTTPSGKEACMAANKVLVPYNFTRNDEKAIDLVIQNFGQQPDSQITIFHVYTPIPNIETSDKTVMIRLSENLAYLRQKIYDLEPEIVKAKQRLVDAGFSADLVDYVFKPQAKDAAQDIIEHARKGRYTAIVMNQSPGKIRRFFTISVSKRVIKALKDLDLYMVG
jgi:hypothetical protein